MRRGGQRSSRGSVYRAVFAITFDPSRCLSPSLSLALHPFSVLAAVPFRSSWLASGRCAFVAPTIALPISVITACETLACTSFSSSSFSSSSSSLLRCAFVCYRPSWSFPPSLSSSSPRRLISRPRFFARLTSRSPPGNTRQATLMYECAWKRCC